MVTATQQRIVDRVVVDPDTGCWLWRGTTCRLGYPRVNWRGTNGERNVSRLAHLEWTGQIPDGWDVHHACGVRACVNPEHLEAKPTRALLLDTPVTPAAQNAAKDACDHGHELSGANLRLRPSPRNPSIVWRVCVTCAKDAAARNRARRRA